MTRILSAVMVLAVVCMFASGCNPAVAAANAVFVVKTILNIVKTDAPSLEAAGLIDAAEAANIGSYADAGLLIDSQADSCVAAAKTLGSKTAALVACLTTLAAGLSTPQELALLRVKNPKAQNSVQIWATASTVAINGALDIYNAIHVSAPAVAAMQPTRDDLTAFARHAGIDPAYGY